MAKIDAHKRVIHSVFLGHWGRQVSRIHFSDRRADSLDFVVPVKLGVNAVEQVEYFKYSLLLLNLLPFYLFIGSCALLDLIFKVSHPSLVLNSFVVCPD